MSSDSDEDELLQMALEEQSRGASGKPSQKRNPAASSGKVGKRMVDDEDDSDVEMLSISSGDEDSGVRNVKSGGGGRGARGDDRGWEGGEPACWKNVDESELARRVRDMREARIIPVVPKMEKKGSGAGRKLNSLLSIPRGMECIDPLGLGIIDQRSLRLITDSLDQSTQKDALDGSVREKLMFFSEEFDPKMFLARVHGGTCAADLEAGAYALKTDFKGRTQQRKQLVKENFDCFVSCKNTIDDIEAKLRRIEEDPEGSGTSQLQKCILEVASQANQAFEPLLERQAQAEKIRAVQGILQRFRTLFNLPSTIRGSIRKGEYDLAVREYKKAKSIGLPSHVGILKNVLEEVDKVMRELKRTLYKSLEDPSIDSTHTESTLRLLLDLEPETDPVWHYLNIQNQRIRSLLEKCTSDHEARIEAMQFEKSEKALSEAKWREIGLDKMQFPDGTSDLLLDTYATELAGEEVDALRGKYIRGLTAVVINLVPAFWRMAVSVFSGKFAKSSQVSAESNTNSACKTEEKVEGKLSSHSLDEIAGMIRQTLSIYEAKVHGTFQELEESNILHPYMNDCIKEISKACQALGGKESAPPVAVSALRMLHSEITKIYILRLCSWMRSTTEEISNEETWVPVSILERNKSPYTISFMPLAFRSVLSSAMDQTSSLTLNLKVGLVMGIPDSKKAFWRDRFSLKISDKEMIQAIKSEAARSEDMFVQLREIQEAIRLAFLNCFLDFAAHLENIGADLAQSKYGEDNLYLQNGYSYGSEGKLTADLPGSITDPHQRLLVVLSNIGYCKDELTYELYGRFKPIWLHPGGKDEAEGDIQDLVISFTGLEEKVLEQYTVAKAHLIREAAMNYLLDSGIQWGSAPQVKGVRDAAVELLHSLVAVHAEVFAGAKPLLDKTLGILVEGLIDTFLSLFHENQDKELRTLDTNGFCQLMLELEYFEIILKPYFTSEARESLKSLQGVLLEKATESVSETFENPGNQNRATRGGEDAVPEERQMSVSPDDLIALAQQYTSELLQAELERTRINTACFVESIPFDTVPELAKPPAYSASGNYRGSTRR